MSVDLSVVSHSQIRRPDDSDCQGGHEPQEGYAAPAAAAPGAPAVPARR